VVAVRCLLPVFAEERLLADIPEALQVGDSPLDGVAGKGQFLCHGVYAWPGDTVLLSVAKVEVHRFRPRQQTLVIVNTREPGYTFTPFCWGGLRGDIGCGANRCSDSGIDISGNFSVIAASIIALSA